MPEGPPFPLELDYLWQWFIEISIGLAPTGFGPAMVTWEAVRAWQQMSGAGPVEPWEARALIRLGMARAAVQAERKPQNAAARR